VTAQLPSLIQQFAEPLQVPSGDNGVALIHHLAHSQQRLALLIKAVNVVACDLRGAAFDAGVEQKQMAFKQPHPLGRQWNGVDNNIFPAAEFQHLEATHGGNT